METEIQSANILIVDDKPQNISLLEGMLTQAGYINIKSTTDPREVLNIYENEGLDLIVLDVRMPHLDGFAVMEQLKHSKRDTFVPVLMITALQDTEIRVKALAEGAKDFIVKPFNYYEVLHRIRNLLETRILYRRQQYQNATLEEMVRKRTQEVEDTRFNIIRRLGRAGEYRDNETGMHVMRMSKACQCLARAAGLDEVFIETILQASPMHDVGKIAIPDNILLKPGKLNATEWMVMKSHAAIGAEIVGDHPAWLIQMARSLALTHHEKWNGSGYPNGLAGENIPIEGRIAAICDVFDALTSERPYKKAWPIDATLELMKHESGVHFDPRLIACFVEILPEILSIRGEYPDVDDCQAMQLLSRT